MNVANTSLHDLFEMERESQCEVMRECVNAIKENGTQAPILEKLMRAAHSIKGAAKLVAQEEIVSASHKLESAVVAIQKSGSAIAEESLDDFFSLIAQIAGDAHSIQSKQEQVVENRKPTYARIELSIMDRFIRLASEILVHQTRVQAQRIGIADIERMMEKVTTIMGELRRNLMEQSQREELDNAIQLIRAFESEYLSYHKKIEGGNNKAFQLAQNLHQEALRSRMRPLSDIVPGLAELTRAVSHSLEKDVRLQVNNQDTYVDRDLLRHLEFPLQQIIKNAVDHGIESAEDRERKNKGKQGLITIDVRQNSRTLTLTISDDGAGISLDSLRNKIIMRGLVSAETALSLSKEELYEFIFLPGFSVKDEVTELSGRGVGLDIVREGIRSIRGAIQVESVYDQGTKFIISLPISLSVLKLLTFRLGKEVYGVPLVNSVAVKRIAAKQVSSLAGSSSILWEGKQIPLVNAATIFNKKVEFVQSEYPVIIVNSQQGVFGLLIEELVGQEDVVNQPVDARIRHIPFIAALATLSNGLVAVILDCDDVGNYIQRQNVKIDKTGVCSQFGARKSLKKILVVDDSLTVRELERKILQDAGFEVSVAVDGVDGLQCLLNGNFDLLITDVDMPRMNGFQFIEAAKKDLKTASIPVVIVSYKDRVEDKKKGLEVGADAYLTKGSFQDDSFLLVVKDLLARGAV